MRIGWHIPLPGPLSVGGTLWRSKPRRRRGYHGTLPGWKCPDAQAAMQTAIAELQTLVSQDPGNAAIPELTEALKSMLGVLEGRTTDAAPGQETAQ